MIQIDLGFAIDAAFARKQLVIAFPQLDVHVETVGAEVLEAIREAPPKGSPKAVPNAE